MDNELHSIVFSGIKKGEDDGTLLPRIRDAVSRNPASVNERDKVRLHAFPSELRAQGFLSRGSASCTVLLL